MPKYRVQTGDPQGFAYFNLALIPEGSILDLKEEEAKPYLVTKRPTGEEEGWLVEVKGAEAKAPEAEVSVKAKALIERSKSAV